MLQIFATCLKADISKRKRLNLPGKDLIGNRTKFSVL